MRILISMHSEPGHHLGTFRLAKALHSKGHNVTYLGLPCVKQLVEEQGFSFIEFAKDLFPGPSETQTAPGKLKTRARLTQRLKEEVRFRRFTTAIVDGSLDACLASARPDLLLCDAFLWYVAMRALRLGIPTIQMSTSLFLFDNSRIPPAVSSITPRTGFISLLQVSLAWKLMHMKYMLKKRLASHLVGAYRHPQRMHHLTSTFHWVAQRSQFRSQRNKSYVQDEIGPHLILPELVLCTPSFQFPGCLPSERRYCGDFTDFQRHEPSLQFDPSNKTIILCSLGTSAGAYREARKFYSAVVDASREVPEWFFVLHISDPACLGDFQSSANLLVTSWVPQLSLLQHASVMVNHGGLNSIMECVQSDVPMVIFPCARDQPGNAARAAYHHLALTDKVSSINAERLRRLIASAMNNPTLKTGLKRLKDCIEHNHGVHQAVEFIEDHQRTSSR